jgi:hypothetical protein
MLLDPRDAHRFFTLHKALIVYVDQRLRVLNPPADSDTIGHLRPDQRIKLRDALVEHLDLIDAFVEENPCDFDAVDLTLVRSWKDLVAGPFYVLRVLRKHAIFLTAKQPIVAYGALGLTDPIQSLIVQPLPYYCKTVLLPFEGRIVYDGVMEGYNVVLGRNMTRGLNDSYNAAKQRHGVVTRLPWIPE